MTQAVVLIGPAAVGKGEVLKRFRGIAHCIEVKALILQRMNEDPNFQAEVEELISLGQLLDDSVINKMVADAIDKVPHFHLLAIDGAGRSLVQVEFLREHLLKLGYDPNFVIFSMDDKEEFYLLCESRLKVRMAEIMPGEQRTDDKAHRYRFDLYMDSIDHIEAFLLRKKSTVHFIDPSGSKEEIFTAIYVNTGAVEV